MRREKTQDKSNENPIISPNMQEYFAFYRWLMKKMGTWPFSSSTTEYYKAIMLYVTLDIMTIIVIFGQINQNLEYTDITIFVEGICVMVTFIITLTKNMITLIRRKHLQQLILMLDDLYNNTPIKETVYLKISAENTRQATVRFSKSFYALTMCIVTMYAIMPWVKYSMHGEKVFNYPSKFPIDMDNWAQYLTFYVMEILAGYRAATTFSSETLFAGFIDIVCIKMDTLLETLKISLRETRKEKKTTKMFKKCVKYHLKLYTVCEAVENFYSLPIILQFLFSTVTICFECFLSTQVSDVDKLFIFILYFLAMLQQLFLFCYYGQKLETKRENFADEVFFLQWYTTPNSYQMDYKFFLMRCLKQVKFLTYNFFPCNMAIFYGIVKTSMSYYVILLNAKKKETGT